MEGLRAILGKGPASGNGGLPALALVATATLLAILLLLLLATSVAAENNPPTAIITSPDDGDEFMVGDIVTFDGSESLDDDKVNLTYEWNISGQIISGRDKATIQRSFSTPGDVLVVLRVIDSGSRDSRTFVSISIRAFNNPPVAIITNPEDGQRFLSGKTISFDGSASFDPDGGPLVYRWETNRTIDPIGTTASFSIRLPLGRYQVTLFVFDQVGDPGTAVINITVEINVPPQLSKGAVEPSIGPRDLEEGFNFSVTYRDADNDPPTLIQVKVGPPGDQSGHLMVRSDPGDVDYRDGVRFHANVELPAGEHVYVFTCRDLFYSCATVLYHGPLVYHIQTIDSPNLGTRVTINWTQVGSVTAQAVLPPGPEPPDTVMISAPVRVIINPGVWSEARLRLEYTTGHIVESETITLLWYDSTRALWVPASRQHHDTTARTVEGDMPSGDVVMAVFGRLSEENVNNPPNLVISYDIRDAFQGEVLWFDASCSTDPDGTLLLFYWDFTDDGEPGPWVPGVTAFQVFDEKGEHQVVLMAIDGGNEHFKTENVTIRAEREYEPGPWDDPDALFLLASLLVIAFGLAIAYRLRTPRTYEDLYGKAYRKQDEDEYSQLFRKLTEEELMGDQAQPGWDPGEGPEEEPDGEPEEEPDGEPDEEPDGEPDEEPDGEPDDGSGTDRSG